jgi:protein-L-isoaspartate(D-aspartate) O-methyltransferase
MLRAAIIVLLLALAAPPAAGEDDPTLRQREQLVQEVADDLARLLGEAADRDDRLRLLEAMRTVPRHRFVPPQIAPLAYLNRPLPVGYGQTVSQPTIVAMMTELAALDPDAQVMLVGIGGGDHAALLSRLVAKVVCVELYEEMARSAGARLDALGFQHIEIHVGDGYYGWRREAPYDAIIVRQAVAYVPPALLAQLKPGGRLVLPLGPPDGTQQLTVVEKNGAGETRQRPVLPVRFTTLPGGDRI